METAVSILTGVVALVVAGCLGYFGQMLWPKVIAALVMTGVAGIVNGTIGDPVHKVVTRLDNAIAHALANVLDKDSGAGNAWKAFTGLLGLALILALVLRVYKNKVDLKTFGLAACAPLFGPMVPGTIGSILMSVLGIVPYLVNGVIGWMFTGSWGG